jgi:hypothetical protein
VDAAAGGVPAEQQRREEEPGSDSTSRSRVKVNLKDAVRDVARKIALEGSYVNFDMLIRHFDRHHDDIPPLWREKWINGSWSLKNRRGSLCDLMMCTGAKSGYYAKVDGVTKARLSKLEEGKD